MGEEPDHTTGTEKAWSSINHSLYSGEYGTGPEESATKGPLA
jgi:hypothetical protein